MQNLLLVFSNPLNDRHEDLNDWYTNVHIRDVMRMPASVAVQRFILDEEQLSGFRVSRYRYLAMYETDDTVKCTAAHAVAMTPKLPISDAFDLTSPCNYFRLRSFMTSDPIAERDGDIVVAEFDEVGGFNAMAAANAIGRNGILSIAHLGVLGDQLVPRDPTKPEIALIRLTSGRHSLAGIDIAGIVPGSAIVSHYRPLIRRLTADDVLHANPEQAAVEAKSRAALEGKQHCYPTS